MTLDDFIASLRRTQPPANLTQPLAALWCDAKTDWHAAHEFAQQADTPEGAWVHAYLHRKEGDLGNADYWYRRARKTRPNTALEEEWKTIVNALLG